MFELRTELHDLAPLSEDASSMADPDTISNLLAKARELEEKPHASSVARVTRSVEPNRSRLVRKLGRKRNEG